AGPLPRGKRLPSLNGNPAAGRDKAEGGAEQGGLAGAIRPDQADEFAAADGAVNAAQHRLAAQIDFQILHFQQFHGRLLLVCQTSQRKKGAPTMAVSTPSFRSLPGLTILASTSAARSTLAPP